MSNITPFDFEGHEVRFFTTNDNSFEVVAADVAKILDYTDTSNFADLIDIEYKYLGEIRRGLSVILIKEAGFYQGLARSNKPKAKPFQKWVYEIVIPSIRKTGTYSTYSTPMSSADMFLAAAQTFKEHELRISAVEQQQETLRTQQQTFEEKVDPYIPGDGYMTFSGFKKKHKYHADTNTSAFIVRCAATRAKKRNIELRFIADPIRGEVKTYPEQLLLDVINDLILLNQIKLQKKRSLTWINKL